MCVCVCVCVCVRERERVVLGVRLVEQEAWSMTRLEHSSITPLQHCASLLPSVSGLKLLVYQALSY